METESFSTFGSAMRLLILLALSALVLFEGICCISCFKGGVTISKDRVFHNDPPKKVLCPENVTSCLFEVTHVKYAYTTMYALCFDVKVEDFNVECKSYQEEKVAESTPKFYHNFCCKTDMCNNQSLDIDYDLVTSERILEVVKSAVKFLPPTPTIPTTNGPEPTTIGQEPTTIGPESTTIDPEPTTIGQEPTTIGPESTTIGPESTTIDPESTTIGPESTTIGQTITDANISSANEKKTIA